MKPKTKTIKICSRDYDLKFDKTTGASSCEMARDGDGKGQMTIGTEYHGLESQAASVIHEAFEAIMMEDSKRFFNYTNSHNRPNFIFIFDHDYLCTLEWKLLDALVSSGFFKIVDGKK